MPSGFAHGPPGAIRSGFAGRKPSGIPATTVLRPWCLGQFQLSFPVQPRRIPRSSGHIRETQGIPVERRDLSVGKGYSASSNLAVFENLIRLMWKRRDASESF